MNGVLMELYATTPTDEIARMLGFSRRAVAARASRLGIRKTKEHADAMRRKNLAKAWGSGPNGIVGAWSRMTEGERNEMRRRMSEAKKKIFRRDRRRLLFGLPQISDYHIPLTKLTKRQVNHRFYMRKFGYITSKDSNRLVIYYDGNTVRKPEAERRGAEKGFTYEPLDS